MTRKMVRVIVSTNTLMDALHFPIGTKIYDIQRSSIPDTYTLFVENDDLEELPEGGIPPVVYPIYEAIYPEIEPKVVMKEWGIKKDE